MVLMGAITKKFLPTKKKHGLYMLFFLSNENQVMIANRIKEKGKTKKFYCQKIRA